MISVCHKAQADCFLCGIVKGVVFDKELTLGKRSFIIGKQHRTVDSLGQFAFAKRKMHGTGFAIELFIKSHGSAMKNNKTELFRLGEVIENINFYAVCNLAYTHDNTLFCNFGQIEFILFTFAFFVLYRNLGMIFRSGFGRKFKNAFSLMHRQSLDNKFIVFVYPYLLLAEQTIAFAQFKSDTAWQSADKMTALRIKVECNIGQLMAYPFAVLHKGTSAVEHVLEIPVIGIDLIKYREHATKNSILAPVKHISCICTYLVISG